MTISYYTTTELFDDYITHYNAIDKAGIEYTIKTLSSPVKGMVTIQTSRENACAIDYLYRYFEYTTDFELYLDEIETENGTEYFLDITSYGNVGDEMLILQKLKEW